MNEAKALANGGAIQIPRRRIRWGRVLVALALIIVVLAYFQYQAPYIIRSAMNAAWGPV